MEAAVILKVALVVGICFFFSLNILAETPKPHLATFPAGTRVSNLNYSLCFSVVLSCLGPDRGIAFLYGSAEGASVRLSPSADRKHLVLVHNTRRMEWNGTEISNHTRRGIENRERARGIALNTQSESHPHPTHRKYTRARAPRLTTTITAWDFVWFDLFLPVVFNYLSRL